MDCIDAVRSEMDERVINLVDTLNSLPGIETFSSCGGHDERSDFSQCEKDMFLVSFFIDPDDGGLESLGMMTYAGEQIKTGGVLIRTSIIKRIPIDFKLHYTPSFSLIGADNADPDELASLILSLATERNNRI